MSPRYGIRRIRRDRIVAVQVAAVLAVAAAWHPVAVVAGAALLSVTFVPVRGAPPYRWLAAACGRLRRPRRVPAGAGPLSVLPFARPGVRVDTVTLDGAPAAALVDAYGTVVVLEPGSADTVTGSAVTVPMMPDLPVQVLIHAVAPPDTDDPPVRSYRDLTTDGGLLARRVLLAVRVPGGVDSAATVREVRRRLAPAPVESLGPAELAPAVAVLTGGAPVLAGAPAARLRWRSVCLGGTAQVTYHFPAVEQAVEQAPGRLVPELLAGAAGRTTLAISGSGVTVRRAAGRGGAAPPAPAGAVGAVRLDGAHAAGLAATLPLAVDPPVAAAARSQLVDHGLLSRHAVRHAQAHHDQRDGDVRVGPAGILLGHDRRGVPRYADLFRPGPVRVLLVGGSGTAVLLAWRALGAGARVVVHTPDPRPWTPLTSTAGRCPLRLVRPEAPAEVAEPWSGPVLHMWDPAGAGPGSSPGEATERRTESGEVRMESGEVRTEFAEVVVRPRVTPAEVAVLARATMLLAEPLSDGEAAIVSATLGLGTAGADLRCRDGGSLAVVDGAGVGWVRPGCNAAERALLAHCGPHPDRGRDPGQDVGRSPAWVSS